MAKKSKSNSKGTKEVKVKPVPRDGQETLQSNEEHMDFGGLPDRDLKKNLGCG